MTQIESEKDDEIRAHKIAQSAARNGNDMTPERTRELLTHCAKACGYDTSHLMNARRLELGVDALVVLVDGKMNTWWNPLESSADEAEMEAKLRLDVTWRDDIDCVYVGRTEHDECFENYFDHPTPQAARRMAGCRAAEAVYLERGK